MKYTFSIIIHPVVNHHTQAAELYICNDEARGDGSGIILRQKHIKTAANPESAEVIAEDFCKKLYDKLVVVCKTETANLTNAKP